MASAASSSSRTESPVMTISSRAGSSQRSAAAAAGPPSTSHLESTITRLLVATKQLLEGLARWSRREVDENAISEIYVKLGNDFNVACAAFAREGITMNELLSVPADLRVCLETCLSDQPSQATLERHLPQVRQIIIGLLHGLREKQRLYREGVAARRQRDARAASAAAAAANVTQQQQSTAAPSNLTPTSANRSRDELRRFVTQTQQQQQQQQQQQATGPTASTSSSSMGANDPAGRPPRGETNESFGAPTTRRSASDQGLPYSSFPNGVPPSGEARFSATVTSSRSSSGTTAASGGGTTFPPRSGSIRDLTRTSSSTHSQNRSGPEGAEAEDAFGPVQSPSSSSPSSTNRLMRSVSSASLETQSIPAPVGQHQFGNAGKAAAGFVERSATATATATGRIMMSPPPPPRRSKRDEEVPAVPPRTPTTENFDPMMTTSASAHTDQPARHPPSFSRHPSAGSIRSLTSTDGENAPAQVQMQAASLEALRADNLSRRASKRYSAYAIQKMTSPNTTASSSGGGGGGGGGLSPSPSSSSGFGGGGGGGGGGSGAAGSGGDERNARAGKAGASSSAGRELAGVDAPRRSRNEHHPPGPSSRPSGHRSTSSSSMSRRDAVPPLPPMPRSYTAAATVGGTTPASPIAEEEHERSVDSITFSSSSSSPGPPTFPPPPIPSGGGRAGNIPLTPQPQRSNSSSSLSRETLRAGSPSVVPVQHLPQLAPSGLPGSGSIASFSASDEPEYPCSIFLQIGRNVKKARLSSPPEVASLRQLFVERFGYNPGLGEWPDIYLRDADSGVHYELEEMSEITAGSVLSLNVDTVEQVKTHIDHGLSSLAQEIKELRATVSAIRVPNTSANALLSPSHRDSVMSAAGMSPSLRPSPSERDFEHAAKRVLRSQTPSRVTSTLDPDPKPIPDEAAGAKTDSATPASTASLEAVAATPAVPESAPGTSVTPVVDMLKTQHADVQTLRREIGVLRQVYADWTTQTKEMFASVRVQTSHVQHLAKTKLSTDRTFVEAGTARLDSESTDLVVKVDELQDSIEQLRADTVRGVKPRPQTLSETASALRKAVETRQKLSEWLKEVKPTWSQMWSNELGKILGEQKAVEQQETLLGELDEDLEDVAKVFKNIQAVAKQLKTTGLSVKPRERDFGGSTENPQEGLSTVLLEVKALSPDPTKRLEAIERAEKQRQAELASRTDEFTEELGDFVGKGRLKKSGGIEETERIRQARSEATLRSMFQS